jgi:Family of unknown function (DUF5313)
VTDAPDPGPVGEPIERPNLLLLLKYSLGFSLPRRYSSWVLHDVTCRTWLVRHFARTALIVVPIFVLYMALMPSSLSVRLLTGLTFSGAIFMFSLVNIQVDTDRRAVRAGYGASLPARIRSQQSVQRQGLTNHERRERIAERRNRRDRRGA